ncbi:hypothetical protein ARMGADRAFT_620549 [Armillaria gallica]|uniref:Uncharacterized protein n=1 Tax=Armillaria gallica TaxID=47427 RepID=A0A2H3CLC8_ARMGA|nr:hypothetical protein ARMGADRAFT_620549 [Armillaria gallica]
MRTKYILDKADGNAAQVNGHSSWGSVWNIDTHEVVVQGFKTNVFCSTGGGPSQRLLRDIWRRWSWYQGWRRQHCPQPRARSCMLLSIRMMVRLLR